MQTKTIWVSVAIAALLVPATAVANHEQGPASNPVTFEHGGGNEWWVDAWITGNVHVVFARVEGKAQSHYMQGMGTKNGQPGDPGLFQPDQAFYIAPGKRIQFLAQTIDGDGNLVNLKSCYFTHPAGEEQCDGGAATAPFDATFNEISGTTTSQRIDVSGNFPIRDVFMTKYKATGPVLKVLSKESKTVFVGDFSVRDGMVVQFDAYSGLESESTPCMKWPSRTIVACP